MKIVSIRGPKIAALSFCIAATTTALTAQQQQQSIITTVAGTDGIYIANNVPAREARLSGNIGFGLAVDPNGNLLVADAGNNAVFRITPNGILTTAVGNGIGSFSGDGGPARSASLYGPQSVAVDAAGNIYIADSGNQCIRKISANGIISTIAGNGISKFSGDNGPATQASLTYPDTIAVDPAGNVYVGSFEDQRIRKITPSGIITTVVGTGTAGFSGDGKLATTAQIQSPAGLAFDAAGNLYFTDSGNYRIRKVDAATGIITTVAGGGYDDSLDETPALEAVMYPIGIFVDKTGAVYFTDIFSDRVGKLTPKGTVVTVAGGGELTAVDAVGPARSFSLTYASSVAVDAAGTVYIADQDRGVIRVVNVSGQMSTFAGNGAAQYGGDGGPATLARFNRPQAIAAAPDGSVLVADYLNNRIRKIAPNGTVTTLAGNGEASIFAGSSAVAIDFPTGVEADDKGNVYVADHITALIRRISPDGRITTVAGIGPKDFSGDGGPATAAALLRPTAVKVDRAGNIYIVDGGHNRIRRIDAKGIITTVAGGGTSLAEGVPAVSAALALTQNGYVNGGLAIDTAGNLYIADTWHNKIRRVTPDGIIRTVAGNGRAGSQGDGGPALNASLQSPFGLALDTQGNLLIADQDNHRVRKLSPAGIITTLAGNGRADFAGDGGPPQNASLRYPSDVAVDSKGNIFIDDQYNNRIREIPASAPTFDLAVTSLQLAARSGGPLTQPRLVLVSSPVPGLQFVASVTTGSGGSNWLRVSPESGGTPRLLEVTADPAGLAPGTYAARITVTVPGALPASRAIAVSFEVTAGLNPALLVDKANLSFTFPRTGTPRSEAVVVANSGGGTLNFTVAAATSTGGVNWLRATPASGQATPTKPATVAITADPSRLAPGTYTGRVVVTASTGETRTVSVTTTVSSAEKALLLTQTGLSFSAVQGGGVIPPQTFGVINTGNGLINWTATPSTLSGGSGWLSVTPNSGTMEAGKPAPVVAVRVDPTGLAAGSYYGLIRVDYTGDNPAEVANSPQVLTVFLEVLPASANPAPLLQPGELVFSGVEGGPLLGSQEILVYNTSPAPKSFRTVISDGTDDFTISAPPRDGTLLPGEPARITVQPRLNFISDSGRAGLSLPAGVYSREIQFQFSDGTARSVPVRLIVASAPGSSATSKDGSRSAGVCAPTKLVPSLTSLSQSFAVSAGWPVALDVNVQDDCGAPLGDGFVSVSFSNGDAPVLLQPLNDGRWQGSWATRNTSLANVTLTVEARNPALGITGTRQVSGDLRSPQDSPSSEKAGIVSAASFQQFVPVAPGGMISIFGTRLAETTAAAQTLPLPTQLGGTEILMAGRSMPLLFVSQNQINAVVPAGVNVNTSQQILIRRGVTLSRPIAVDVAATQPAVFMAGTNPIIVNASTSTAAAVLVNDGPVKAGDILVAYTSGLGLTDPSVADGAASPSSPVARTSDAVTVTIGGIDAPVLFSGLVPGFAALYQINIQVPPGIPPGNNVPVLLRVGGQTSPAVTMTTIR